MLQSVLEFIAPMAQFFGVSPLMLLVLTALSLMLLGAWYVLKFILKLAWKIMLPGCLLIVLVLGGLYAISVILTP